MKYVLKRCIDWNNRGLVEQTLTKSGAWAIATNSAMVFDTKAQARQYAKLTGNHVAAIVPVKAAKK